MIRIIREPVRIAAHGSPPKQIEEYVGRLSSATQRASVARMNSPAGWGEPGQTPEFDELTLVLRGVVVVETNDGAQRVTAGQAIIASAGTWVRYSTPEPEGAEYIAVCLPAFAPDLVHRDAG
jgi:quercetin dioxygenase-like cupin family protein